MRLTVAQAEELDMLTAARAQLLGGQRLVKITRNGRAAEYAAADLDRLDARIAELEAIRDGRAARRALRFSL